MRLRQIKVAAAAVAVSLGAATAASALTLGSIPGGAATNDGLVPVYPDDPASVQGYYGAQLGLFGGPADITVAFLGSEAEWTNGFDWGSDGVDFTTPGVSGSWSTDNTGSMTVNDVASGLLDFLFATAAGDVVNGSNPDGTVAGSGPNFFVTFKPSTGETATSGTIVDLWLDDNGAGPDDNHDDMLIRLTADGGTIGIVPVPASIPLLLSGLAGLGFVARRRSNKA